MAEAIVAHAREAAPGECCGILLGRGEEIVEAVRAGNLSGNPNRFVIDPADHVAARRRARALSLDVAGFYHSHPHSMAMPSPTDIAEHTYAEAVQLIVSLADPEPAIGVFRIAAGAVERLEPVIEGSRRAAPAP